MERQVCETHRASTLNWTDSPSMWSSADCLSLLGSPRQAAPQCSLLRPRDHPDPRLHGGWGPGRLLTACVSTRKLSGHRLSSDYTAQEGWGPMWPVKGSLIRQRKTTGNGEVVGRGEGTAVPHRCDFVSAPLGSLTMKALDQHTCNRDQSLASVSAPVSAMRVCWQG